MGLVQESDFLALERRLKSVENRLGDVAYEMKGVVRSELSANSSVVEQSEMQYGLYTGLCVDTIDIWKQNRIRFFCPIFHDPTRPIKELPWAYPVSSMGGFDDCGLNWVPPAGSTVVLLFECGHRASPFYLGTTWQRNRGPQGGHNWGYNIEEYYRIWEGHRKGYLVGPNDESQVMPQWNTESYNGFDLNSIVDFAENPEAQKRITYPHIYGFKTPEKHMLKMVDGDPKCNRRWKRLELMSGDGNWMMFKDDHLHYGGQWSHPSCGVPDADVSCIEGQDEGNPGDDVTSLDNPGNDNEQANTRSISPREGSKKENTPCEGKQSNSKIIGGHPSTGHPRTKHYQSQQGANPFFKHENECRPYKGPATPQNNKCDLPQSGVQIMSISGHTFVMDDSVEEPSGDPGWERSTESFNFGCNDKFVGRMYWRSATGHMIELSDVESPEGDSGAKLRGEFNYIRLLTATGNRIELNDHTVSQKDCPGCPPNVAGEKRGITMETTSKHKFEMLDEQNEQCGECRKDGGIPVNKAKKAFIRLKTGYGLEWKMADDNDQQKTDHQFVQLLCPQKDNKKYGEHIHRFQESLDGSDSYVLLRVGGYYKISTYSDVIEIVGDRPDNPSDKIEYITKKKYVFTKDGYINRTEKSQIFIAKENILLLAGEDCEGGENACNCPGEQACIGPVLVYDLCKRCIRISDRVYASASQDASPASITDMMPFSASRCKKCGEE